MFLNRWMNETKLNEKRIDTVDKFKQIMKMPCNNKEGYGLKTKFIVKDSGGHEFYYTYFNQLQDLRIHVKGYFTKNVIIKYDEFLALARQVFMIYIEEDKTILNIMSPDEQKEQKELRMKKWDLWEQSIGKYEELLKLMEKEIG